MSKKLIYLLMISFIYVGIILYGCKFTTTGDPPSDEPDQPNWSIPALAAAKASTIHGESLLTVDFTGNAFEYDYDSFVAMTIDADSYIWDFGDGSISFEQNPSHNFTSPGLYLVKLTVGVNGAAGTDLAPVVVYNSGQFTSITGELTEDTTWESSGSPYIITDGLTIPFGKSLTISQETIIVLASGIFSCYGNLNIQGTASSKPVVLSELSDVEEELGNKFDLKNSSQTGLSYIETYDTLFEIYSNAFSAENCHFYNSPISFYNRENILLSNNIFEHRKREDEPAIKINSSNNITIQNSNILNNAIGISAAESTGILIDNCQINDNLCHNGIILGLSDVEVGYSSLNNNSPHAILIIGNIDYPDNQDYAHAVYIHDNTIRFNHADSVNFEYFYGKNDYSTIIEYNEIAYDRKGNGILVEYGAFNGHILIENNNIHHNGLEETSGHLDGITIEDAGRVTIRNNTISHNHNMGINLNHGLNTIIEFNTISLNGEEGIILQNSSEAWVKDNILIDDEILVDEDSTLHQDY